MYAGWLNKMPLTCLPPSTITWHLLMDNSAFVGALRSREESETPLLSKNKESHFEKSGSHPVADVSTLVLAIAPDTAPCP